jgi:hypothetical protein
MFPPRLARHFSSRRRQSSSSNNHAALDLTKATAAVDYYLFGFCRRFVLSCRLFLQHWDVRPREHMISLTITHFNRIFKRHVGKSPPEYRESLPKAA